MKATLTAKQQDVFCFLVRYFKRNDHLPSATVIATHFKCSQANASAYLRRLREKGWLESDDDGRHYRFVRGPHHITPAKRGPYRKAARPKVQASAQPIFVVEHGLDEADECQQALIAV